MQNRPHVINDSEIFVKRALSRITASIPERLVVTNRLVVSNSIEHDRDKLRVYLQKFGPIINFNYEHGLIDFDVTRISRISSMRLSSLIVGLRYCRSNSSHSTTCSSKSRD